MDTFAAVDEPLVTGVATLAGAAVGGLAAVWAGKKAADETANAEATRQQFAREDQEATRRAAARLVELQLSTTRDLFERALETNWLPAAFEIPSWDDIRVLSPALTDADWKTLADAMRWLRYVRTLAATLAAESPATDGAQVVATSDISSDIRDALPPLEAAVALVSRQADGVALTTRTEGRVAG